MPLTKALAPLFCFLAMFSPPTQGIESPEEACMIQKENKKMKFANAQPVTCDEKVQFCLNWGYGETYNSCTCMYRKECGLCKDLSEQDCANYEKDHPECKS
eukprot:TRINITY_DN63750_c0_g1_i1.p1 TRINITY_DN63750_c0_g1~~TRINITY_DN63750_c0_g1_i1.p1  ORF type:complete len:101 (+),score=14.16 TRINITY_DN63750_c0_g1_i1:111-413(+)